MTSPRSSRLVAPLLLTLAVALAGCGNPGTAAPAAGTAPTPTTQAVFETAPPAPSATVTVVPAPPSATAPSATPAATATPTEQTPARDIPTDEEAVAISTAFLTNLQGQVYDSAWQNVCEAGRARYADGAAVQDALGLSQKRISRYSLGSVGASTFNDDPRKIVIADVTYSNASTESLNLSITLENGAAAVCGF